MRLCGPRWETGKQRQGGYHDAALTVTRPSARALPVLDIEAPVRAAARAPEAPLDVRLTEYRPEAAALPRFHVWTLGCQMNRSDSEEMAGRLLSVGCEEAATFETADLVVINTCAIREGAEQKVIGRQGHLARLKAASTAGIVWASERLWRKEHRKTAVVLTALTNIGLAAVVAHNYRVAR